MFYNSLLIFAEHFVTQANLLYWSQNDIVHFAKYAECNCAVLQNTWNDVNLQSDLHSACSKDMQSKTLCVCQIRRKMLLCLFTE
jgi:hypothetical protein